MYHVSSQGLVLQNKTKNHHSKTSQHTDCAIIRQGETNSNLTFSGERERERKRDRDSKFAELSEPCLAN